MIPDDVHCRSPEDFSGNCNGGVRCCNCGEGNPETAFHIETRHVLHVLCGVYGVVGLHNQRKAFMSLRGWEEMRIRGGGG